MLSLIICSRTGTVSPGLHENIRATVGIEYELVIINNKDNRYSIFSAYNEGVRRAKYDLLCFMHDDILYYTQDWGQKVVSHFSADPQMGVLGVVGGHYFPKLPAGWFHSHVVSGGNVLRKEDGTWEKELYGEYLNGGISVEAVAVDGLWFCIPKRAFEKIRFDETTFQRFHCYDVDICLQARRAGLKVYVGTDIDIWHRFSGGCNQAWVDDTLKLYEKWKDHLPQEAGTHLTNKEKQLIDWFIIDLFDHIKAYNN